MTGGDDTSFVPENPLEEALAAAVSDPSHRGAFFDALVDSELLIPAPGPPPAEDRLMSAPAGSEIDLPVVEDGGRSIVPAFTSMGQLLRFVAEGTGYVQIAVRDLVKLWRDDLWLGLNPRGPGVLLGPDDVRRLAPENGEYLLGEPREEPETLIGAVRAYAERSGNVVAAYRALMVAGEGAEPRVVVGLELADGADRDTVFAQVTEAGRETGIDGFALVPVTADATGPVARYLLDRTKPFYRRDE